IAPTLPKMMAFFCWCAGSERQASAITTALSPDSTMLIRMIWERASQNTGLEMTDMLSPRGGIGIHRKPVAPDPARLRNCPVRHLDASFQPAYKGAFGHVGCTYAERRRKK